MSGTGEPIVKCKNCHGEGIKPGPRACRMCKGIGLRPMPIRRARPGTQEALARRYAGSRR